MNNYTNYGGYPLFIRRLHPYTKIINSRIKINLDLNLDNINKIIGKNIYDKQKEEVRKKDGEWQRKNQNGKYEKCNDNEKNAIESKINNIKIF